MIDREKLFSAIRSIGWGYLLLHFNIFIGIDSGKLHLLPNFLGMRLILEALPQLVQVSPSAKLLRPLAWTLFWYELGNFVLDLVGYSLSDVLSQASRIVILLLALIQVYFHFQLLTDVAYAADYADYPKTASILHARTWYVLMLTALNVIEDLPLTAPWVSFSMLIVNLGAAFLLCKLMLDLGKWGLASEKEEEPV